MQLLRSADQDIAHDFNNENSAEPTMRQELKGWRLPAQIWFWFAGTATLLDLVRSILSGFMHNPHNTEWTGAQLAVAVLWAMFWLGIIWLALWKRWMYVGHEKNRYLGWTYGQAGLVLFSCVGVLFSLFALPTLAVLAGEQLLLLYGWLTLGIFSTVIWIAHTIAIPEKWRLCFT